jgi:hypothetical protein
VDGNGRLNRRPVQYTYATSETPPIATRNGTSKKSLDPNA